MSDAPWADRLAQLEARVAALEQPPPVTRAPPPLEPADAFWALEALRRRALDQLVLFMGSVTLPSGEHFDWQESRALDDALAVDPAATAASLDALAHPVRVVVLLHVLHGTRSAAELGAIEGLGTTGQLYHHLRQLVASGWLTTRARGQYFVPPQRVIPLLVVLAAAQR